MGQSASKQLQRQMEKWLKNLPESIKVPRSIGKEGGIAAIDLHVFADASGNGVATAVYALVFQEDETSQELLTAKARIAKKGLTIPRLELVAGHMAANLVENVRRVLTGYPVRKVYGWLDSSVALHWIKGENKYKQFVSNRVASIKEKDFIEWRHVPSEQNPADVASRGSYSKGLDDRWYKGPSWIQKKEQWPAELITEATDESEVEATPVKASLNVAVQASDGLDAVLEKHDYLKAKRITAWVVNNFRSDQIKQRKGPISIKEINEQIIFWTKSIQSKYEATEKFKQDQQQLDLQKNHPR